MKIKIKTDVEAHGKKYGEGTVADMSEKTALCLIGLGWAEEVVEEVKAPKAKTRKTAKK